MKVIAATGNQGKLREFRRILEPLGFSVTSMKEEGIDLDIVEDGDTFAANARIKAMAVHAHTGHAVVADDSGLCVDALDGRPGVYSARYGGEDLPHPQKIRLLLEELREVSDLFESDVYDALNLENCMALRGSYGGPAVSETKRQIEEITAFIKARSK